MAIGNTQKFKDPAAVGTNLLENLLHERAYSLNHFASEAEHKTRTAKLTEQQATHSILKEAN